MTPARFEVRRGRFGRRQWRFVLIARNGEVIATSEHYQSVGAALGGIEAVRALAPDASVVVAT